MHRVNLGDKVRDTITGFTEIAISRTIFLQGCDRIAIQPIVGKDGTLPEYQHFDEPQLEVLEKRKVKAESPKSNNGGPDKYLDRGKSRGKRGW